MEEGLVMAYLLKQLPGVASGGAVNKIQVNSTDQCPSQAVRENSVLPKLEEVKPISLVFASEFANDTFPS